MPIWAAAHTEIFRGKSSLTMSTIMANVIDGGWMTKTTDNKIRTSLPYGHATRFTDWKVLSGYTDWRVAYRVCKV